MSANTTPIFCKQPAVGFVALSATAVSTTDGTDANVKTVFTADATNGSKIEDVYIVPLGTTNAATVVRFWVNNGSSAGTATNNSLVHEEAIALATLSGSAVMTNTIWRSNLVLKPGYKLLAASGATTSVALQVSAVGGDY